MKKLIALFLALSLLCACACACAAEKKLTVNPDGMDLSAYSEEELLALRQQIHLLLPAAQKGDLLYEDDNIAMYYLGWKKDYRYEFWVTLVNKTDLTLMFSTDDTSINDCACYAGSAIEVPPQKRTNREVVNFSDETLAEQWIDQVDNIEFTLHYYDSNDWDGLRVDVEQVFTVEYAEPETK